MESRRSLRLRTVKDREYYESRGKLYVNEEGCWEWRGYVDKDGYGRVSFNGGGNEPAHRYFYKMYKKKRIPKTKELAHTCRLRHCCNPDHVVPKKKLENLREIYYPYHQFVEDVMYCLAEGLPTGQIAEMFGMPVWAVRRIARRENWRDIQLNYAAYVGEVPF